MASVFSQSVVFLYSIFRGIKLYFYIFKYANLFFFFANLFFLASSSYIFFGRFDPPQDVIYICIFLPFYHLSFTYIYTHVWAFLVAQWERTHLPSRRQGFHLWVSKIPWRRK